MSFDLKIVKNDIFINQDGTVATVRDNEKLRQDIIKILLTQRGSNPFFNWYGSDISTFMIGNPLPQDIILTEVERNITAAITNLIGLQQAQSQDQYVSAGETLAAIRAINIRRNTADPRVYEIQISIITKKLTIIDETFSLVL